MNNSNGTTNVETANARNGEFLPDHWNDLEKSGLTKESVQRAGIYSSHKKDEIIKILGYSPQAVESVLVFPYPNCGDFARVKVFPPYMDKDGKVRKYLQKEGSGVHLYVPPQALEKLNDGSCPLYITEGEKKALRAVQGGLCCVGLGGIWNWKLKGQNGTIDEIKRLSLLDRKVYLVPDNDWLNNPNVLTAVHQLGTELEKLGANVQVVALPQNGAKEKVGLDDYLTSKTVEDFKALKPINMKHNIFKKNHTDDAQTEIAPSIEQILNGQILKSIRPAQDYQNGKYSFGISLNGAFFFVNSDRKCIPWDEMERRFNILDENFSRSAFLPEGIRRYIDGAKVSPAVLHGQLKDFISRYVVFQDPSTPSVVALWVMGTYCFMAFKWYGYLWVNSPTKRSGKSLLLELLSHTTFNCNSVLASPSVAFLFREVSANSPTILIDELEQCRDQDKEKFGDFMSLMNMGCKKGGTVPRVEKIGNKFRTAYYQAYGPKALAGISQLSETIMDRTIKVHLLRKKNSEKVERFNLNKMEPFLNRLKDDLHIFALEFGSQIADIYGDAEKLKVNEELDDRAKDIFEPLFAIAHLIDHETKGDECISSLRSFSANQAGIRSGREAADDSVTQIVRVLQNLNLGQGDKRIVTVDELFTMFRMCPDLTWIENKKTAGSMLRKLGLESKAHRINGQVSRAYSITHDVLRDLKERYLPCDDAPDTQSGADSNVTSVTIDGEKHKTESVTEGNVTDANEQLHSGHSPTENPQVVTDVTGGSTSQKDAKPIHFPF